MIFEIKNAAKTGVVICITLLISAPPAVKSDSGPIKDKQALICDDEEEVHANGIPNGASPSKFEILEPEGNRRKSVQSQE